MRVSIVIRTLNEARYLGELLEMVARQRGPFEVETLVVDSGSTDGTTRIAKDHGARLVTIDKSEFSFGRSLNRGCAAATGEILVFVSGHCVPVDEHWLARLCAPVADGVVDYAYGRQVGDAASRFAERRIFAKYFGRASEVPQEGFFCNNANAALSRAAWEAHRFDEELTGLEDMELAKRLVAAGGRTGYVAEACVLHHHAESWPQVRRRFEREAIALQRILPEVQISRADVVRYVVSSVWLDWRAAARERRLVSHLWPILRYRVAQYGGSFAGNHEHRRLSRAQKERFFYPTVKEPDPHAVPPTIPGPNRRPPAHEGQQSAR